MGALGVDVATGTGTTTEMSAPDAGRTVDACVAATEAAEAFTEVIAVTAKV